MSTAFAFGSIPGCSLRFAHCPAAVDVRASMRFRARAQGLGFTAASFVAQFAFFALTQARCSRKPSSATPESLPSTVQRGERERSIVLRST